MSDKSKMWWIEGAPGVGLSGDVILTALVGPLFEQSGLPVLMRHTPMRLQLYRRDPRIRLVPPPIKPPPRANICRFKADWGALQRRNVAKAVLQHHGVGEAADSALPQVVLDNAEIATMEARHQQPFCMFSAGTTDTPRRVDGATWRALFEATPHIRWFCGAHRQIERFDAPNVTYEGLLLSLREYIALVRQAALVVTIDGSLSHLAVAVDTPSIVLHTGQSAKGVFTWPSQRVIDAPIYPSCSPCYGAPTCQDRPCTKHSAHPIVVAVDRVLAAPRLQARPPPKLPAPRPAASQGLPRTQHGRDSMMVPAAVLADRTAICHSCSELQKNDHGTPWCGAGPCSKWKLSGMAVLRLAKSECPQEKWNAYRPPSGEQS